MFSVAILAKEELKIVKVLLDHYEKLGAEKLFLFFDGRSAEIRTYLAAWDGVLDVEFKELTTDFWMESLGHVPLDFQDKQRIAYKNAIARNSSDWIFLCDADELVIDRSDVNSVLLSLPRTVESVRIPTAEACWLEAAGEEINKDFSAVHFRRPMKNWRWRLQKRLLYGGRAPFFQSNLLGHSVGKQFLRRGTEYSKITSHFTFRNGQNITAPLDAVTHVPSGIELAHFDATSFPRWLEKFRRRIDGETIQGRTNARNMQKSQLEIFSKTSGEDWEQKAGQLFREFYVLNNFQYTILRSQGLIFPFQVK